MKLIFFSIISLIFLIIQTSFLNVFLGSYLTLDLSLIMVVYFGISFNYHSGIFLSFIVGYLTNILSGIILGAMIFIRLLNFTAVYKLKKYINSENIVTQSLLVFLFSFIENLGFSIYFFGLIETVLIHLPTKVLPQALLNSLFTPLIISILRKADNSFFNIKKF